MKECLQKMDTGKKNLRAISFKKNDSIKTLAEDPDRHHVRKDVDHRQYIKKMLNTSIH